MDKVNVPNKAYKALKEHNDHEVYIFEKDGKLYVNCDKCGGTVIEITKGGV